MIDAKGLNLCQKDQDDYEKSDDDSYYLIFIGYLPYDRQYTKLFIAECILNYLNVLNHVSSQLSEIESVTKVT